VRYLVKARVKPGCEGALIEAVKDGSIGRGSIAGEEYLADMLAARIGADGVARWVEVCFCTEPLEEERPYWEKYFEPLSVTDAHSRRNCRHENGSERWACCECDCTRDLEDRLRTQGQPLLRSLG
jgi:hypothetical protein